MNKFRLSSRLFSYVFWESILSSTDINDGKREKLFQELSSLEKLRKKADYNTGSISNAASWCLYCIVKYFRPQNIMEIGTFIGKSSWSMARAQDDEGIVNGYLATCDFSNDISIPWNGRTKIKQYKKQSSTNMLNLEEKCPDLIFIDGRIQNEDLLLLENLLTKNTIILIDDFEGIEKGVVNYMNLKKLKACNNHFLIYPCERLKLKEFGENSYSSTAVMLPNNFIELVAQG